MLSMPTAIAEYLLTRLYVLDLITQTSWPDKEQLDWRFLSRSKYFFLRNQRKARLFQLTLIIFKTVLTLRSV